MAYPFYITIEGQKQGKFKGDEERKGQANKISGIRYLSEIVSPRDSATGQASGKRMHKPVMFTKEWGASSPQLFQACTTNEILKSVLFEFLDTDASGQERVHFTVKLTNASIARIKSYVDLTDTTGDAYDAHELEDVELVFQKIELDDLVGKTTAVDDWNKAV